MQKAVLMYFRSCHLLPLGGSSFFMGTWFPSRGVDPTVPEPRCLPRDADGWRFPNVDDPFHGRKGNRSKSFRYKPSFLLSDCSVPLKNQLS